VSVRDAKGPALGPITSCTPQSEQEDAQPTDAPRALMHSLTAAPIARAHPGLRERREGRHAAPLPISAAGAAPSRSKISRALKDQPGPGSVPGRRIVSPRRRRWLGASIGLRLGPLRRPNALNPSCLARRSSPTTPARAISCPKRSRIRGCPASSEARARSVMSATICCIFTSASITTTAGSCRRAFRRKGAPRGRWHRLRRRRRGSGTANASHPPRTSSSPGCACCRGTCRTPSALGRGGRGVRARWYRCRGVRVHVQHRHEHPHHGAKHGVWGLASASVVERSEACPSSRARRRPRGVRRLRAGRGTRRSTSMFLLRSARRPHRRSCTAAASLRLDAVQDAAVCGVGQLQLSCGRRPHV
jgi:hypothetical protein